MVSDHHGTSVAAIMVSVVCKVLTPYAHDIRCSLPTTPSVRLEQLSLLVTLHNPRSNNLDLFYRPIRLTRLHKPQPLHNAHAALHTAEDGVFAVKPRRRCQRDEELAPVGVGARVRHGKHAGAGVPQRRADFVGKGRTPAGCAAAAGSGGVACLDHEVRDDAVHRRVVVVAAAGEGGEVLACLGGVGCVELQREGALLWGLASCAMGEGWIV